MQIFQVLWTSSVSLLREVFSWHNLAAWQFYVFIYLAFAIGSSITLSPPDIKGALKGFYYNINLDIHFQPGYCLGGRFYLKYGLPELPVMAPYFIQ